MSTGSGVLAPHPHLSPSSSKLIRAAGADGAGGPAAVVMNDCMFSGIKLDQRNPAAYAAAAAAQEPNPAGGSPPPPITAPPTAAGGRWSSARPALNLHAFFLRHQTGAGTPIHPVSTIPQRCDHMTRDHHGDSPDLSSHACDGVGPATEQPA